MRNLVCFMHVSLDGFVAGPGGAMDWIRVDDEIFACAKQQTDEADTALYGRITYDMMNAYWPTAGAGPEASRHDREHSAWYNRVTKVVVSRTRTTGAASLTRFIGHDLAHEIAQLKQASGRDILMFGSPTVVHHLTRGNLIDEYWLLINPVLLGAGVPLFKDLAERKPLKLESTRVFASGVVGL